MRQSLERLVEAAKVVAATAAATVGRMATAGVDVLGSPKESKGGTLAKVAPVAGVMMA